MKLRIVSLTASAILAFGCKPRIVSPLPAESSVYVFESHASDPFISAHGAINSPVSLVREVPIFLLPKEDANLIAAGLKTAIPCFKGSGCAAHVRGEIFPNDTLILVTPNGRNAWYMTLNRPNGDIVRVGEEFIELEDQILKSAPINCAESAQMKGVFQRAKTGMKQYAYVMKLGEFLDASHNNNKNKENMK